VHCFGSGELRPEQRGDWGNPYPLETAIFRLENSNLAVEITRFMFQVARGYSESFSVYGEDRSFEWQQIESEQPVLFERGQRADRGTWMTEQRISAPDRADLHPPVIARLTQTAPYDESKPHLAFPVGGGHGGAHPHLVHTFIRSTIEDQPSAIDTV
jgi:hypothetical protein